MAKNPIHFHWNRHLSQIIFVTLSVERF